MFYKKFDAISEYFDFVCCKLQSISMRGIYTSTQACVGNISKMSKLGKQERSLQQTVLWNKITKNRAKAENAKNTQ